MACWCPVRWDYQCVVSVHQGVYCPLPHCPPGCVLPAPILSTRVSIARSHMCVSLSLSSVCLSVCLSLNEPSHISKKQCLLLVLAGSTWCWQWLYMFSAVRLQWAVTGAFVVRLSVCLSACVCITVQAVHLCVCMNNAVVQYIPTSTCGQAGVGVKEWHSLPAYLQGSGKTFFSSHCSNKPHHLARLISMHP